MEKQNLIIQDLSTPQVGIIGRVMAELKRANEEEFVTLWDMPINNKVVNKVLAKVAYLLGPTAKKGLKCGAIGTGSTAATASDTALESQILTRKPITFTTMTTSATGDTAKMVTSFTSDGVYSVTEYATFETDSGAPMFNRVTFAAISLTTDDVLKMTCTAQVQEA